MWSMPKFTPPHVKTERIAFYGPMASGKTYLADFLVKNNHYMKYSFASKLKSLCYELYGIDKKDGESRKILQQVGQQLREHDPDVWIKYELTRMYKWMGTDFSAHMVIDDLRYENEAKALRDSGFYLIKVVTPLEVRYERVKNLYPDTNFELASTHDSEMEWKYIEADYEIDSSNWEATWELKELVRRAEDSIDRETSSRKRASSKTPSTSAQV